MSTRALAVALADGLNDAARFWPLILGAFLHAVVSCLLLGLSFQQVSEAGEVSDHLHRWEQQGAASLHGVYLARVSARPAAEGMTPTLQDGLDETPVLDPEGEAGAASRTAGLLSLLEDPQRLAYTMDPYGDRFGDDLPGAMVVTEDFLRATGVDDSMTPTGAAVPRDSDGAPAPYAVLGSASRAKDPHALLVDGAPPPTTRVQFQGAMIPVVGRLAQGATTLDPMMGSVPLDEAALIVLPAESLPGLYPPEELEALLLRTVVLGPDAVPVLDASARPFESERLLVAAQPLTAESSGLLQSLTSSSRTLVLLFGAAVLGAVVSLFGALGVLARALAPTWRIAAMVGAARWQAAVRIAVPVLLAWVLPAGLGLLAGAAAVPGPSPTALAAVALALVLGVGCWAALSSWRALAATFGPRRRTPTRTTTTEAA